MESENTREDKQKWQATKVQFHPQSNFLDSNDSSQCILECLSSLRMHIPYLSTKWILSALWIPWGSHLLQNKTVIDLIKLDKLDLTKLSGILSPVILKSEWKIQV